MKSKAVIFANPRSGSTTLADIIGSQGYSVCYEPFNPALKKVYYHRLREEGLSVIPSIMENYDCVKHLSCHGGLLVDKSLLEYKSLILKRKNILKAALSYCISTKIGVWKARELSGNEFDNIGEINLMNIRCAIGRMLYINKYKAEEVVFYEDLYGSDWENELKSIFEYFGFLIKDWDSVVSWMDIRHKMNSNETYGKISNIKEIEKLGSEELGWL